MANPRPVRPGSGHPWRRQQWVDRRWWTWTDSVPAQQSEKAEDLIDLVEQAERGELVKRP
jgi:hypothetical protein